MREEDLYENLMTRRHLKVYVTLLRRLTAWQIGQRDTYIRRPFRHTLIIAYFYIN
jgi:hypothetical protein